MVAVKNPGDLTVILEQIRERAEDDPAFAESLPALVAPTMADPFDMPAGLDSNLPQLREMNQRRQAEQFEILRARSFTTAEVVDVLATVRDRKGVDRRRKRGTLLGIRDGNRRLHPRWQFDLSRGRTWDGLAEVLAALRAITDDRVAQDAIVTSPHPDAAGASIAQVLAEGDVDTAVALIRLAGDQS